MRFGSEAEVAGRRGEHLTLRRGRGLFDWNEKQRRIIQDWRRSLRDFAGREWRPALLWGLAGCFVAMAARVALHGRNLLTDARETYLQPTFGFHEGAASKHHAVVLTTLMALFAGSLFAGTVRRGVRSWLAGCASGIPLCSALSSFCFVALRSAQVVEHTAVYLSIHLIFWCMSFALYFKGRLDTFRTITEEELHVGGSGQDVPGGLTPATDEPIESWKQDALGRAAIVEILTSKIMIGKAPVIALSGPLGVGKTSVLNLLEAHLSDRAIVVRFVTWLPGSQDALSSYLLADIAKECRKHYVVPGLSRSASRVARALAASVPYLKGLAEYFPAMTQRDDILALREALSRIPKRVVVLLDELDRMEKGEVLTLLKMLRGISGLPNCTFLCAVSLEDLMQVVRDGKDEDSRLYFEKFFPVTVTLPKPNNETLRRVAVQRVVQTFASEEWFRTPAEQDGFESDLAKCWKETAAPFCGTFRSIGLLVTDLEIAARLLRRQVDALDLTLITALRRFKPDVYGLVSRSARPLTGGEHPVRSGEYLREDQKKREVQTFRDDLKKLLDVQEETAVRSMLKCLFPKFSQSEDHLRPACVDRGSAGSDRRISEPSIFPAYFRHEIPEEMFSFMELEQFLGAFRAAGGDEERGRVYGRTLKTLRKGSLKRDDFLRKLAETIKTLDPEQADELATAAVSEASEYTYDLFSAWGESGHVLRMVMWAAQKMPYKNQVSFLADCIGVVSDDTLALRILRLTEPKEDAGLMVTYGELAPAFMQRMRERYSPNAAAETMDLSASDPEAFQRWSMQSEELGYDPEDRKIQRSFWLRRIGSSRKALAEAFDRFLLPSHYVFRDDPTPYVETMLPLADLAALLRDLPEAEDLDEGETAALLRLRKLLAGEYSNGIPMSMD